VASAGITMTVRDTIGTGAGIRRTRDRRWASRAR
jgi:hypothetical protein